MNRTVNNTFLLFNTYVVNSPKSTPGPVAATLLPSSDQRVKLKFNIFNDLCPVRPNVAHGHFQVLQRPLNPDPYRDLEPRKRKVSQVFS